MFLALSTVNLPGGNKIWFNETVFTIFKFCSHKYLPRCLICGIKCFQNIFLSVHIKGRHFFLHQICWQIFFSLNYRFYIVIHVCTSDFKLSVDRRLFSFLYLIMFVYWLISEFDLHICWILTESIYADCIWFWNGKVVNIQNFYYDIEFTFIATCPAWVTLPAQWKFQPT